MAEITLDKTEFETLHDCKVGEPLALTGTVTAIDGDQLTINVESAEYNEEAPEEEAPEPVKAGNPVSKIGVPGARRAYA